MAITVVQTLNKNNGAGVASTSLTSQTTDWTANVTTGNTIIVIVFDRSALGLASITVTDSNSNSYTQDKAGNVTDAGVVVGSYIFRASNVTGGNKPTITVTASVSSLITFGAVEVSGLSATPLDATNNNGAIAANPSTGSVTTANVYEIAVIAFCGLTLTGSITEPSGFTSQVQETSNTNAIGDGATQIYAALQSGLNPAWTANVLAYGACIVTYTAPPVIFPFHSVIGVPPRHKKWTE